MLLILREEMICAVVLIFLIVYYVTNKVKDKKLLFLKQVCFALAHVIFDIITVVTVNNRDVIPEFANRFIHILFYLSGILFILAFHNYIMDMLGLYKHKQTLKVVGYAPLAFFIVLLAFLPIEYVEGNGTYYSYGPLVFAGYGIFILYCVSSMIFLFVFRQKFETRVKWALMPMIGVMFVAVVVQALVPELLMTGAALTFVCIGVFVALDNPDKYYKEQALWDFLTQLKNRNCYNKDLEEYIYKFGNKKSAYRIGFVVADMNCLKIVNDHYGHAEGDKLIMAAAEILHTNLKSAENVYRLGGDEFVAIYLSPDDDVVANEIENVKENCSKITGCVVLLSIAIGYAAGNIDDNTQAIFDMADQLMYENKKNMNKEIHVMKK